MSHPEEKLMHSCMPDRYAGSDSSIADPDIIIEAGILLTMAQDNAPIENARVVIKGDRIVDIQSSVDKSAYPEGVEVIHAERGIVMPGLINAHAHTAMTLFRGLADDLPLKQWLFDKIFPAEAGHLSPETVYWGTLLGCLEMIASGTTTVIDGYFYEDDAARAVQRSGMRALVGQGVIDFPAPGVANPKDNLRVGEQFLNKWTGVSDLITPGLFCHSPITCSDSTLKRAWEISKEYGLLLQIQG